MSSKVSHHVGRLACILATLFASLLLHGQDKIVRKGGQVLEGKIIKGDAQTVTYTSGGMTAPVLLKEVEKIEMVPPIDLSAVELRADNVSEVIQRLNDVIKDFKGLPVDWVAEAMALLADAYQASNQNDKANAIYEEMRQLYPNQPQFLLKANLSAAKSEVRQGKTTEALKLISPLIEEASTTLNISDQKASLYAEAHLIQGMIFEREQKLHEALQAYVKVYTLYPQGAQAAAEARAAVERLRADHPKLYAK
ncbi:MAG: tetratricopeptide repeat protein [Methylacidiphilales bacterium]|nr:tetratricopeptide repeat protein [Candidatus Methylacidiphilales bacterium]MDW8349667.1 tetratricopeptide repeat protein [Verrucomicrobiae bacterium]